MSAVSGVRTVIKGSVTYPKLCGAKRGTGLEALSSIWSSTSRPETSRNVESYDVLCGMKVTEVVQWTENVLICWKDLDTRFLGTRENILNTSERAQSYSSRMRNLWTVGSEVKGP